ncbi:MAG: histidine phosphatase family protein [Candidatus Limnocylindrales bacterium]
MTSPAPLRDASLVLIRHGRTAWVDERRFQGSTDVPLSVHGRLQAEALGARLMDQSASPSLPLPAGPPRVIRHSPLARASDTAAAVARARNMPDALVADPDLREIAQGAWEGLRHEEVLARWPDELARWRHDPVAHHAPGAESVEQASVRAGRALERILDAVGSGLRPTEDVVEGGAPIPGPAEPPGPGPAPIVDEHDPWSIAVAHDGILRLVLLRLLELPLGRYWSFPFAPCGISVVEIRDGRARLRVHNLETHLGDIGPSPTDPERSPPRG